MFCLHCGGALEQRTFGDDRLEACAACNWVHFDAPVPVAGVIVRRDHQVLLARPHYADVHVLVSGFLHPFESVEEAAVREVREETGYDVEVERVLGSYSCRPMGMNQLLVVCVARVTGGALHVQKTELADARWFPVDALPSWPEEWPVVPAMRDYLGQLPTSPPGTPAPPASG